MGAALCMLHCKRQSCHAPRPRMRPALADSHPPATPHAQVVGLVGGLGMSWQATFGVILTLYFYSHYFFASGARRNGAAFSCGPGCCPLAELCAGKPLPLPPVAAVGQRSDLGSRGAAWPRSDLLRHPSFPSPTPPPAAGAAHIGAMYTAFLSVAMACGTPGLMAALALGACARPAAAAGAAVPTRAAPWGLHCCRRWGRPLPAQHC